MSKADVPTVAKLLRACALTRARSPAFVIRKPSEMARDASSKT
jgi:hypothetical protein